MFNHLQEAMNIRALPPDHASRVPGFRVLIVAHAPLATAFACAAADILATRMADLMGTVVPHNYRRSHKRERVLAAIANKVRQFPAQRWIIITDLTFFASPGVVSNELASELAIGQGLDVRLLSGLNTAMLLTAMTMLNEDIDHVRVACEEGAHSSIVSAKPVVGAAQIDALECC